LHLQSGKWDLSQIPLDRLYGTGVVIDLSQQIDNYGFITLEMVQSLTPDAIRENDIVVLHTGWHRYSWCGPLEDETRYFAQHPGPSNELVDFFVERNIKWVGTDCPAFEHPLNTAIRDMRPDLVAEFELQMGKKLEEQLPRATLLYAHKTIAANNQVLVECLGGGLEEVLNRRLTLGAFPWRFKRGEASIARVVAFVEE
ncbi:MAG: cyclase family protein, partial [Dehalococcoidia bacterium]